MNEILNMYFRIIEDPRCEVNVKHRLVDVLKLVMIASLCGMDELEKIIDYGKNKLDFLREEFGIEAIPSKSTLTRIFCMISPKWLEISILGILNTLIKEKYTQIMLDGKAIKITDAIQKIEKMMNIVTAYTDTGVSLGQITVDEKSNEIPAVRELIDIIDVKGTVVTADAMHCQKETAEKIIANKGDYVLQLKANQGNFYEEVKAMFDNKYMDTADKDCEYETYSTIEKSHGRIEKRTCYVLNEIEFFTNYKMEWKHLSKIFAVKREVEKAGKKTEEISCYISSKNADAKELLGYTRKHWEIESMHYILDVTFNEDNCKLYSKRAQENMNIFRKLSVSIHKNYLKNKKQTIRSNMFNCLLNNQLLMEMLQKCNNR